MRAIITPLTMHAMDEGRQADAASSIIITTTSSSTSSHSSHPPSHHLDPIPTTTPHRRKERTTTTTTRISSLGVFVFFLTCCISLSAASHRYIDEQMVEAFVEPSEDLGSALDRLARSGTIVVDQGPPPNPKAWTLATEHDDLQRRAVKDASSSSDLASATSMITTATTSSQTASKTSSGLAVAATGAASPLPSPFDQGFSGNITDSCQSFMDSMLTNDTFKSCLPFSLLLQNSNSFFQASKSLVRISQTLDATCAANITTCTPLMSSFANNITSASACASDISSQNPLVMQAHLGLLAYKPLYTASCLRNPSSSSYCFADAVTNVSSPTDSYIYYLPLNISLPGGSQPTCDSCLRNTMAVFEAASADRTSALASDYVTAAQQVNVQCGPTFVNASLASPVVSAGGHESMSPSVGMLALALLVGSWLL